MSKSDTNPHSCKSGLTLSTLIRVILRIGHQWGAQNEIWAPPVANFQYHPVFYRQHQKLTSQLRRFVSWTRATTKRTEITDVGEIAQKNILLNNSGESLLWICSNRERGVYVYCSWGLVTGVDDNVIWRHSVRVNDAVNKSLLILGGQRLGDWFWEVNVR